MKNKDKIEQKHGVPALINIFAPGVGQIIKGEIFKGIGVICAMIVSCLLMFVLIGFITTPILYIWQIYDAYNN